VLRNKHFRNVFKAIVHKYAHRFQTQPVLI